MIHAPGHTPGSIALFNRSGKIISSGDLIFQNGFGTEKSLLLKIISDDIIYLMAVHFDSSSFGEVVINGQSFGDVLVVGGEIEARDDPRLERELESDHLIGDWEVEELLSNQPEIVIVGTGTAGVLRIMPEVRRKFEKAGVELIAVTTPRAIEEYNSLVSMGKKVNALIHTTC